LFERLMVAGGVPREEWLESMHVVRIDGRVRSAGEAVIELMVITPGSRRKVWSARLLPWVRKKIESDYRRLAARRGELSGKVDDVEKTSVSPRWVRLPD
jgi:predicted DCC family thiol-disulfide oxidoreductase YuxK